MTDVGNHYDEILSERVKHLTKEKGKSIWPEWEIRFMGTIKMIQGDDEVLSKSDIVTKRLSATKFAGKLTLSLLPKFKSNDLSPIMDHILHRGSDMSYYPICRLNLTGTAMNGKMMKVLINTVLDDRKYKYLEWLNFTQCGITSKLKKKKLKKNANADEKEDEMERLDLCSLLAVGLRKNKSLKFLFLSKNPSIDPVGLKVILEAISNHPSLRCLRYNTNQMSMGHAQGIHMQTFYSLF